MNPKEPYDPAPEILEQFLWAVNCCRKYQETTDGPKFRKVAQHLLEELLKYLIK